MESKNETNVDEELKSYLQNPNPKKHIKHAKPKNVTIGFLICFQNCIDICNNSHEINVRELRNSSNEYYLLAFVKLGLVKIYKTSNPKYISIKFTSLGQNFNGEFCREIGQMSMLPEIRVIIFGGFVLALVVALMIGHYSIYLISFILILIFGILFIFLFKKYYQNCIVKNQITFPKIIHFFKTVGLNSFEIEHKIDIIKHYNLIKPHDKKRF